MTWIFEASGFISKIWNLSPGLFIISLGVILLIAFGRSTEEKSITVKHDFPFSKDNELAFGLREYKVRSDYGMLSNRSDRA